MPASPGPIEPACQRTRNRFNQVSSKTVDRSDLKVELRPVSESDIRALFTFEQDPVASTMAAFPSRDWDRFSAHWHKLLVNSDNGKQAILVDGQVVGSIVSWGDASEREVGYWIDRTHWGRGVATRALALYLELEQTRPLYAHVASHNTGSTRVLQKCGFVTTGTPVIAEDGIEELTLVLVGVE
jgi:RimJ/RimL family protein N-acetyltransferase